MNVSIGSWSERTIEQHDFIPIESISNSFHFWPLSIINTRIWRLAIVFSFRRVGFFRNVRWNRASPLFSIFIENVLLEFNDRQWRKNVRLRLRSIQRWHWSVSIGCQRINNRTHWSKKFIWIKTSTRFKRLDRSWWTSSIRLRIILNNGKKSFPKFVFGESFRLISIRFVISAFVFRHHDRFRNFVDVWWSSFWLNSSWCSTLVFVVLVLRHRWCRRRWRNNTRRNRTNSRAGEKKKTRFQIYFLELKSIFIFSIKVISQRFSMN